VGLRHGIGGNLALDPVAYGLASVAAAITVARPAAGNDAHDHLAAYLGLADLVPGLAGEGTPQATAAA
jgi:hypothetical protein